MNLFPGQPKMTTGLPGLDRVLKGVMPGDNIVWRTDTIDDYRELVTPYAEAAKRAGQHLIYFRFASHPELLPDSFGAEVHHPKPSDGFERFVYGVHDVIERAGRGAIYVFDCLSELAEEWCADQMLGNFFMLTCPRLWDLETVTYFGLYRNRHTMFALRPIEETTQFMLDVFRQDGRLYIRPVKVQYRSTDAMNTIHVRDGEEFRPVTASPVLSRILAGTGWPGLQADQRTGFWRRIFQEARTVAEERRAGGSDAAREKALFERTSRLMLSCDPKMLTLVDEHMTLDDVVAIRDRMIGTGFIGGKAVGMLLARAVCRRRAPDVAARFEAHDSFFIGSEVFHTFLVRNKVWWIREKQRNPETFLQGLDEARERILRGDFPDYTIEQFRGMLEYFGEAPYIVRSSSLLEDACGNAFSGKYDSIFCVNRGTPAQRLDALLAAVRQIYASALSEPALRYRQRRGLLDRDEQMALLVMRVSGAAYGRYYYPQVAGVGLSFNPYAWSPDIDPRAGVVRLVFGLGTRAVDRADDDYTRLVALNAPFKRPETTFDDIRDYSQRRMDGLDLVAGRFLSASFDEIAAPRPDLPLDLFASPAPDSGYPVLTFDRLLRETPLVSDLRTLLSTLESAYGNPVDIEFAVNFLEDGSYRIHLLQCRTLQVRGEWAALPGADVPAENRLLEAHGAVIGGSRQLKLDRIIFVAPSEYARMSESDRYGVARLIGRLNQSMPETGGPVAAILGPGRWGTSSPSLGIPVTYTEINRFAVVCEIVAMHERLIPDVSLGTHFFNDLVEQDMLYLALFPRHPGNRIDQEALRAAPNRLEYLVPGAERYAAAVRVVETRDLDPAGVTLRADALEQSVIVFRAGASPGADGPAANGGASARH